MMDSNIPDPPKGHLHTIEDEIKSLEESALALKRYRNLLVPISSLPIEILSVIFCLLPSIVLLNLPLSFSVLPFPSFSVSPISHVCHRWREILLNLPHFWSHINFNQLNPTGCAEMLARAKMSPLDLEVITSRWDIEAANTRWYMEGRFGVLEGQIKTHIHHTRRLSITASAERLKRMFGQLVSSAPSLEYFAIANSDIVHEPPLVIPDNLFDGITPKLVYLRLRACAIGWDSPLLKGLRSFTLISFPSQARIALKTWLDALSQMPRLERLTLHNGVPIHSTIHSMTRQPRLTVVLSFITDLDICSLVLDCIAVLAGLVLPALIRLRVTAKPHRPQNHTLKLIPYVVQNAHGPQDTEALQSLFIGSNKIQAINLAGIVAWIRPRADTDGGLGNTVDLSDRHRLARVAFSTIIKTNKTAEEYIPPHDALLTALPLNSITSLTVDGRIPLNRKLWRSHAPRWLELERVRLFPTAVPAFRWFLRGMLKDAPCGGPLLPSLEELILVNVFLDARKVYYLYDMLIELVELEIPIRTLDLRLCTVTNRAIKLLSEIVADVQGPVKRNSDLGGIDTVGEEAGEEEGTDEETQERYHGFNKVPPFLGSWIIVDDDNNNNNDGDDEDDEDEDEYNERNPDGERGIFDLIYDHMTTTDYHNYET